MFKAEVAQQDGGLADEFRKHLQPDSPLVLMMEDFPRESHDKSREVYNAVCVLVQRNGTHIMKSISAQNGSEGWRQFKRELQFAHEWKREHKVHRTSSV